MAHLRRVLEPEVMDTWEDAVEYDAMDFREVNDFFAERAAELGPPSGRILDCGTGTARIPILMAQRNPNVHITAIDLSASMLKVGESNVAESGLSGRISLQLGDAKRIGFPQNSFDMLVSNSIIHHLPDPAPFLDEARRVLKPNAGILIRDLIRPQDEATVERLVHTYAFGCDDKQKGLFRDSLHAAFTLEEVVRMVGQSGIPGCDVVQSSDRHWSIERKWYREMKKDFPLSRRGREAG